MSKILKLRCDNSFHGTSTVINLAVDNYTWGNVHNYNQAVSVYVSERQAKDARRRLCGIAGCMCESTVPTAGWHHVMQCHNQSRFCRLADND